MWAEEVQMRRLEFYAGTVRVGFEGSADLLLHWA